MTTFSDEVRQAESPYKFGGSRRAAAAWLASLDGTCDDEAWSSTDGIGWIGRIGRRVIEENPQGFVTCERFKQESVAIAWFDSVRASYDACLED